MPPSMLFCIYRRLYNNMQLIQQILAQKLSRVQCAGHRMRLKSVHVQHWRNKYNAVWKRVGPLRMQPLCVALTTVCAAIMRRTYHSCRVVGRERRSGDSGRCLASSREHLRDG